MVIMITCLFLMSINPIFFSLVFVIFLYCIYIGRCEKEVSSCHEI